MTGTNTCAMSEACEDKPADHGLMCASCRAADTAMREGCNCAVCRSDVAGLAPCQKDDEA